MNFFTNCSIYKKKKIVFNEVIDQNKEDDNMAYVISDACLSCGSCEGECPVGAIAQGDGKYEINPDLCLECGSCEAACPAGAISQG